MLTFLLTVLLTWANALQVPVEQGERLWVEGAYENAIVVLEAHLIEHPDDPEALWRLARSYYSLGEVYAQDARDEERLALYKKVIEVAKQLQTLDSSHGQGPFWHGVALGRISTTKGVLSQAATASKIQKLWLRSLTSAHTYASEGKTSGFPASVHYALGQYYRLVPDSWWVKLLTGVRGDIDKSIAYLNLALSFNPQWLEARKEMGVSLLCKAKRDKDPTAYAQGITHLTLASVIPTNTPTESIDSKHIPIILDRWKEACGYSRDGWQDLTESNDAVANQN